MYESFFGLQRNPFRLTPDPDFLLLTASHLEALAGLSQAILRRKGFVVLTGEAGTGKTTLINVLLRSITRTRIESSLVLNSVLTPEEFLEYVMLDFGLGEIPTSKPQRLRLLQSFLLQAHAEGKVCVLIVDEAHKLTPAVLEEIRLLTNFEMPDGKLLQIVLAGQPELETVLDRPDLRQLKQRIGVRLRLGALTPGQVSQYIAYRWRKAGATEVAPFEPGAISEIARRSLGIPRVVNAICDNALLVAFAAEQRTVTVAHASEVAQELQFGTDEDGIKSQFLRTAKPVAAAISRPQPVETAAPPRFDTLDHYQTRKKKSWFGNWFTKAKESRSLCE